MGGTRYNDSQSPKETTCRMHLGKENLGREVLGSSQPNASDLPGKDAGDTWIEMLAQATLLTVLARPPSTLLASYSATVGISFIGLIW